MRLGQREHLRIQVVVMRPWSPVQQDDGCRVGRPVFSPVERDGGAGREPFQARCRNRQGHAEGYRGSILGGVCAVGGDQYLLRMSIIARATPTTSSRTPDSGVVRVASEGRASRAVAQALGVLVERMMALGPDRSRTMEAPAAPMTGAQAGVDQPDGELAPAREALRQLVARSRDGAMLCRVVGGTLVPKGYPSTARQPLIRSSRCSCVGSWHWRSDRSPCARAPRPANCSPLGDFWPNPPERRWLRSTPTDRARQRSVATRHRR